MRGRSSYTPSPSPPRGHGRRDRSPTPRGGRYRDLSTTLFVRNISHDCRQKDLRSSFGRFGPLKYINLPRDYYRGYPQGFGYVEFEDPDDAAEAKYTMDGNLLLGRELSVVFSEDNRKKPTEMRARQRGDGSIIFRDRRRSPSRYYSRSPRSSRSPLPSRRRHSRKEGYDRRRYSRSPAYNGSRGRSTTRKSRSISRSRRRSVSRSPARRSISRSPRRSISRSPSRGLRRSNTHLPTSRNRSPSPRRRRSNALVPTSRNKSRSPRRRSNTPLPASSRNRSRSHRRRRSNTPIPPASRNRSRRPRRRRSNTPLPARSRSPRGEQ